MVLYFFLKLYHPIFFVFALDQFFSKVVIVIDNFDKAVGGASWFLAEFGAFVSQKKLKVIVILHIPKLSEKVKKEHEIRAIREPYQWRVILFPYVTFLTNGSSVERKLETPLQKHK